MTIETALEWSRLWWLLSLDITAKFKDELWLDQLSQSSLDWIRSGIDPIVDLPTYGSDPRPKIYARLHGYEDRFGRQALGHLLWWKRSIFIGSGSDRASEFLWRMAVYSPASLAVGGAIGAALQSVRQECSGHSRRTEEKAQSLRISKWDEQLIAAEQSSRDEVVSLITTIVSENDFSLSWQSHVTAKGIAFLQELYAVVSGFKASAQLQFDPETIPFPSSWEFDLRNEGKLRSEK